MVISTPIPRRLLFAIFMGAQRSAASFWGQFLRLAGGTSQLQCAGWIWLRAYGSVNHVLIDFTLQHFHASPRFRNTVSNLYSGLNIVITTPAWATNPIPLTVGVYQGDPLSVTIFNSVMSTLGESLKQYKQLGYFFSNSPRSLSTLQYADDTCLVADGPSSCQTLLQHVDRWLDWAGMRAKIPKYHSQAIRATSPRHQLQLSIHCSLY